MDERIDGMMTIVDSWMRGLSSGLLDEKTRWMSDSNGLPIVCQLKFFWHKNAKSVPVFLYQLDERIDGMTDNSG